MKRICCSIVFVWSIFLFNKTNAQWSIVGNAPHNIFSSTINSIISDTSGNIYTAGFFKNDSNYNYVAKWNGTTWSELGGTNMNTFNNAIFTLTTDNKNNLYAIGWFWYNGTYYIAKWNGKAWSKLLNSDFNANVVGITTDTKGNIYAAGDFFNQKYYQFVAIWDGTAWSELGGANTSTFNSSIDCLISDKNNKIYAAGNITNANGKQYVAKWNGNTWSELGGNNTSTFNGLINALTIDSVGNIYVAGNFTNANGKNYVAVWDGTAWSEIGGTNTSTFNSNINSIAIDYIGNIYVAGNFKNALNNYYVAEWNGDGSTWSELGGNNSSAFNAAINIVNTDKFNNVYAGGAFTNNNGNFYVAKYMNTPTPLKFINITANKENNHICLQWTTANEVNAKYFIIQRSMDGVHFSDIGTQFAFNKILNNYTFKNDISGIIYQTENLYYRLQEIDNDNKTYYSITCKIKVDNIINSIAVSPNPTTDTNIHVYINLMNDKNLKINILDNTGKIVMVKEKKGIKGVNHYAFTKGDLASGIYFIKVSENTDTKQFIIH